MTTATISRVMRARTLPFGSPSGPRGGSDVDMKALPRRSSLGQFYEKRAAFGCIPQPSPARREGITHALPHMGGGNDSRLDSLCFGRMTEIALADDSTR